MSFLAAWMVDIVEDMGLYDILTGNMLLTYQRYIRFAKLLLQRTMILNEIVDIDGVNNGNRTLGISHLDKTLNLSWTEDGLLLVHAALEYVRN